MNRNYLFILFIPFFLLVLNACSPIMETTQVAALQTRSPVVATITPVEVSDKIVSFHIYEVTNTKPQSKVDVGSTVELAVSFKPVIYQVVRRHDNSIESISSRIWEPHTVTKMRICTSLDELCQLDDTWIPFDVEQTFQVDVDWVGNRKLWVVAQFQDSSGQTIPSIGQSSPNPKSISQAYYTIVGVVDDAISIEELPLPVQAVVGATRAAFPVQGSIDIEDGRCCVGGVAGDIIQVNAIFEGESLLGEVEEMRTRNGSGCFTEDDMIENEWEPFAFTKAYPVEVTSSWIGFYISVQYRDSKGNLSPVYCDDISVEGHVPSP